MEAYFSRIPGVESVTAGYANGTTDAPTYEQVCTGTTGHAETVHVVYDPETVSLQVLTEHFFKIIDPLAENRQGNDVGTQYRSGIYYTKEADRAILQQVIDTEQEKYETPIQTELRPLSNYYLAEEYHQDYLEKNPGGYCHVDFSTLADFDKTGTPSAYKRPSDEEIRAKLTDEQYRVTQQGGTERPFTGTYDDFFEPGIYVDVVTVNRSSVLPISLIPAADGPVFPGHRRRAVLKFRDTRYGMDRTEVKSRSGRSHLGHVFDDGPTELGGVRYCINSASLRFIPYEEMEKEGYGDLLYLVTDAKTDKTQADS